LSVVYRAIWSDGQPDVTEFALERLRGWVKQKTGGSMSVPDEGAVTGPVVVPARDGQPEQRYEADLRIDRASGTGQVTHALSATFSEVRADGSRWDTTLRCWNEASDGEPLSRLWVDVECVDAPDQDLPVMAAPLLAVDLIDKGTRPARGPVALRTTPLPVRGAKKGEQLARAVTSAERDVPFVVFSDDPDHLGQIPAGHTFADITARAARQLAGVTVVHVADTAACRALTEVLGCGHGVWEGAFRIYQPSADPSVSGDYLRHRYVLPDRFVGFPQLAATTISRTLVSFAGARRPPATYPSARYMLRMAKSSNWENLARLLQEQNDVLAARSASLTEDLNQSEERYMNLVIDLEDALKEREQLSSRLEEAKRQVRYQADLLARNGVRDESWTQESEAQEVPDTADNLSDAAAKAQLYLSDRLVLPDAALRDLDDLDSAIESQAWGQSAWRGFRALHAYAVDQSNGVCMGSFWDWCVGSRSPLAWPAVAKKLSMRESETVQGNATLRAARTLPVATEVSEDGSVYMPAHLKISAGGGNQAPRIYFHWDPVGMKVHVGFFGPHKYIPNSKS